MPFHDPEQSPRSVGVTARSHPEPKKTFCRIGPPDERLGEGPVYSAATSLPGDEPTPSPTYCFMRIVYLLDRTEPGGGVKVVFQHASLLADQGHEVLVAGRGPRPVGVLPPNATMPSYLNYGHLPEGTVPEFPDRPDLALATYWTTLPLVRRIEADHVAHFCQGCEYDWPHLKHRAGEIKTVYETAGLPALVVAPHLGERLARNFRTPWRLTPPPLDPRFRLTPLDWLRRSPRKNPWIAVPGIFQAEVKGVSTALEAIRLLREAGQRCRLLRISILAPTRDEESLVTAERFLSDIPPAEVASNLRRCDLLLFPVRSGEGFGLPLLEALASGVPSVASRLPPTEFIAGEAAILVAPGRPEAFARAASDLLKSPRAWKRARRKSRTAAARFSEERIKAELEAAVQWVVSGSPR